ncbi:MAG TPA: cytochrome P450 [Myxococcota bacterium]|nr:cytochrome P450 [Myxococcota bacterium]
MTVYYDPTDWNTQIDPYPIYARLREEAPVYHNEKLGFYALSRFEDVWDAHLDWETFSSSMGPTLEDAGPRLPMMIIMDPPAHTRVRQLVSKVFTPRRIAELEPTVRQITRERLAGLEPGDQIDLFERLGSSMPMDVISTMLGVPAQDRDRIRHLTNAGMHREGGLEMPASARQAHAEVAAYYVDFIKHRQAHPGDDLLSDLIAAEFEREDGSPTRLDFQELLGFCLLLGNAGHETTARLICNSAVTLARNPDQRRQLVSAPRNLMENAVEEMLRYDPPSQVQGRWSMRPFTRHGVTIPPNVRVLMLTGAAHRDERQFPEPDRFDIQRKLDRTVHFGQGHHLCLGKSLARQECRVAFEEILARFPDYEVDEANLEWAHNNNVRGYSKVPMRL